MKSSCKSECRVIAFRQFILIVNPPSEKELAKERSGGGGGRGMKENVQKVSLA